MRDLIADLFISLDGFAGGIDQEAYFGYEGPDLMSWIHAELDQPQAILMGRNTYVRLAEFAAAAADPGSIQMRKLPKLVFSNALHGPFAWDNTQVISGDLAQQIRALKQQPGPHIRSIGSLQLVKGLIQLGLVDRLRLTIFPLILGGAGREPIYADMHQTALRLVTTKVLDSRIVLLEYEPSNSIHIS